MSKYLVEVGMGNAILKCDQTGGRAVHHISGSVVEVLVNHLVLAQLTLEERHVFVQYGESLKMIGTWRFEYLGDYNIFDDGENYFQVTLEKL